MKILIVDDDQLIRIALSSKLKGKGYDVLTASNGIQALEIIEKQKPELIICDIIMPGISGLELLNLLKQFYFSKTPLIIISSLSDSHIPAITVDWGAENFIPKPINFSELYKKVKWAMNNRI
ncbi:MAG: response regulator [Bacteroidetes bacterium]|nr:response regulator [Bacteroidota bacterium]